MYVYIYIHTPTLPCEYPNSPLQSHHLPILRIESKWHSAKLNGAQEEDQIMDNCFEQNQKDKNYMKINQNSHEKSKGEL